MPDRDTTRVNQRIRVSEVRLIGDDGQQIGLMKTADALKYAQDRGLDLVEVAADSRPPVCRVLDYSKYKYEQSLKAKQTRKHQHQIVIREMKLRPKIAGHDYETKKGHVERFLKHHDKVKVTIMFRGREREHPQRGRDLLMKLADDVAEFGMIEQNPLLEGRNMIMVLGPTKTALRAEDPELASEPVAQVGKSSRRNKLAAAKAAGLDPESLEAGHEAAKDAPAAAEEPAPAAEPALSAQPDAASDDAVAAE